MVPELIRGRGGGTFSKTPPPKKKYYNDPKATNSARLPPPFQFCCLPSTPRSNSGTALSYQLNKPFNIGSIFSLQNCILIISQRHYTVNREYLIFFGVRSIFISLNEHQKLSSMAPLALDSSHARKHRFTVPPFSAQPNYTTHLLQGGIKLYMYIRTEFSISNQKSSSFRVFLSAFIWLIAIFNSSLKWIMN